MDFILGQYYVDFLNFFIYGDLRSSRALFFLSEIKQISRKFRQNLIVVPSKDFRESLCPRDQDFLQNFNPGRVKLTLHPRPTVGVCEPRHLRCRAAERRSYRRLARRASGFAMRSSLGALPRSSKAGPRQEPGE